MEKQIRTKIDLLRGYLSSRIYLEIRWLFKKFNLKFSQIKQSVLRFTYCKLRNSQDISQSASHLFAKHFPLLVLGALGLLCLFSPEAFAMKEDSMQKGLTNLESYLTGNIARGVVIGGCSIAAYRAYVDSKFGVLGAAVAGALGLNFLMDFVNATYACLI